jgi:hypothetical protein
MEALQAAEYAAAKRLEDDSMEFDLHNMEVDEAA